MTDTNSKSGKRLNKETSLTSTICDLISPEMREKLNKNIRWKYTQGEVKWFSQANGYGVIGMEGGKDLYFNHKNIDPLDEGKLVEGQAVMFIKVGQEAEKVDII